MCFPVIYEPEEGLAERHLPEEEEVVRRYVELEQARRYLEAGEERERLYQPDQGQCSCHLQPADSQVQLPPPPPYHHIRYSQPQ